MSASVIALTVAGSGLIACTLDAGLRYYREHLRRESDRAVAAKMMLQHHREALSTILEAPDLNPALERFLLQFSERVLDRAAAQQFSVMLDFGGFDEPPAEDDREWKELDAALIEFGSRSPGCTELLAVVLRTGVAAMLLQWPETGKHVQLRLAEVAAETTPQVLRAVRNSQRTRRPRIDGSPPPAGQVPVPA